MSLLIIDEQVKMYNEVRGYSNNEVYQSLLNKSYKCLKKALTLFLICISIGSVAGVYVNYTLYRFFGIKPDSVLKLCLSVLIFLLIVLLALLAGVLISERFSSEIELDFINGIFRQNCIRKDIDASKITVNCNGIFLSMSDGTLVKLASPTLNNIRVVLYGYVAL